MVFHDARVAQARAAAPMATLLAADGPDEQAALDRLMAAADALSPKAIGRAREMLETIKDARASALDAAPPRRAQAARLPPLRLYKLTDEERSALDDLMAAAHELSAKAIGKAREMLESLKEKKADEAEAAEDAAEAEHDAAEAAKEKEEEAREKAEQDDEAAAERTKQKAEQVAEAAAALKDKLSDAAKDAIDQAKDRKDELLDEAKDELARTADAAKGALDAAKDAFDSAKAQVDEARDEGEAGAHEGADDDEADDSDAADADDADAADADDSGDDDDAGAADDDDGGGANDADADADDGDDADGADDDDADDAAEPDIVSEVDAARDATALALVDELAGAIVTLAAQLERASEAVQRASGGPPAAVVSLMALWSDDDRAALKQWMMSQHTVDPAALLAKAREFKAAVVQQKQAEVDRVRAVLERRVRDAKEAAAAALDGADGNATASADEVYKRMRGKIDRARRWAKDQVRALPDALANLTNVSEVLTLAEPDGEDADENADTPRLNADKNVGTPRLGLAVVDADVRVAGAPRPRAASAVRVWLALASVGGAIGVAAAVVRRRPERREEDGAYAMSESMLRAEQLARI
uniref:Uncharacterized protein n=1 Tax=Diacronema lutheri TaxID=2081491 RepID=A0A7R9UPX9_DIALT